MERVYTNAEACAGALIRVAPLSRCPVCIGVILKPPAHGYREKGLSVVWLVRLRDVRRIAR